MNKFTKQNKHVTPELLKLLDEMYYYVCIIWIFSLSFPLHILKINVYHDRHNMEQIFNVIKNQ